MLTARQAAFVREFVIDHNATRAAIRAGYGEAGARVRGSELVANRNVSDAIAAIETKAAAQTTLTAQMLIEEAWAIAKQGGRDRVPAIVAAMRGFPELRDGTTVNIDARKLELPAGTTLEDLRVLRDSLRAADA